MRKILLVLGAILAVSASSVSLVEAGEDPTTHPNPLPLSIVHSEHPRLWFNSDNVDVLRARWTDPAFAGIVNKYRGKNDPISLALEGLATNNAFKCSQAAGTVAGDFPV